MKIISELTTEELHERILHATTELIEREVAKKYEGDMDAIARVTASVDEPETKQPKTVERKAQVGEKILIIDGHREGEIHTVSNVESSDLHTGVDVEGLPVDDDSWAFVKGEYEVIIEDEIPLQDDPTEEPVPIKSPNQQRAELNQRAREFVESKYFCGNFTSEKVINGYHGHNAVEFIVNREKIL